jgi:hypothetical protein
LRFIVYQIGGGENLLVRLPRRCATNKCCEVVHQNSRSMKGSGHRNDSCIQARPDAAWENFLW